MTLNFPSHLTHFPHLNQKIDLTINNNSQGLEEKEINDLASFYSEPTKLKNNDEVGPLINRTALREEFQTTKTLMGKQQLNYQPENVKSVFDKDQEINRLKTEIASFQWGGKKSTRRMQSICCKKGVRNLS